jgi:hypothetical protein
VEVTFISITNRTILYGSAADPNHHAANPDPDKIRLYALMRIRIRIRVLIKAMRVCDTGPQTLHGEPPWLLCEPPQLPAFHCDVHPDPDPAFSLVYRSGSNFSLDADPDPQH